MRHPDVVRTERNEQFGDMHEPGTDIRRQPQELGLRFGYQFDRPRHHFIAFLLLCDSLKLGVLFVLLGRELNAGFGQRLLFYPSMPTPQ